MITVKSLEGLRTHLGKLPKPIGLVPTMGYLHQGHLSLVQRARMECASVVVSIFVNPTQFGPQEDLDAYPRDLARDLALLEEEAVDLVWTPDTNLMYPEGFQTFVTVDEVTKVLEGEVRPGHFRGVATIVAKLFNAIQPDRAYFGQKDAQQVMVIRQMVLDLNYPVVIVVCPTVREVDGLAMSSRNSYLDEVEREAATVLYQSLIAAQDAFRRGERDANQLRKIVQDIILREPLARVQYISCAEPLTLHELQQIDDQALLSMAVFIGKKRLIDNIVLEGYKEA
jgi:pantoate--beta-alanine ligase